MSLKINFNAVVMGLDGKPFTLGAEKKELTLKEACVQALVSSYDDERPTGPDKQERGALAKEIYQGGERTLSQKKIGLIKDLVGKAWTPVIVCQCYELLDGAESVPALAIAEEKTAEN